MTVLRGTHAAGAAAAIACLYACETPPPCFGIKVGDRIAITVVDTLSAPGDVPYDAGNPNVCGFGFDVSQGQVLVATDAENLSDAEGSCLAPIPSIEPFGAWKWTLHGTQTGNSATLGGQYEASNGVCSGVVLFQLKVASGADPFAPSVPGQVPNVVMNRGWLSGSGPGCPTSCGGRFLVNLKRL